MTGTQAQAGQRITASWLNLNIPGNWQAVAPASAWANHGGGSVTFQARQRDSVTLEVIGIIGGGSTTATTVLGLIPAGLPAPITTQARNGIILAGTGFGQVCAITVANDRTIRLPFAIPGATEIGFHFAVPLDA